MTAFIRDNQCAFELTGIRGINTKIRGELHRATHAFWHVHERTVTEDRGVQSREEIVTVGNDTAEIFPDQLRVLHHRFGKRAKNDACVCQLALERGRDGDTVEYSINGNSRQAGAFMQRDSQLLIGLQQLRIDFIQALWFVCF